MVRVAVQVLVLEDDDGIRTSLRLALEDRGYEVVEAGAAEDALQYTAEHVVDAMLVDLMLGGMDGFTYIRRVRKYSEAPIVVLSARDSTDDIVSGLEAGADDYVTKPFVVDEVEARLRALLRRPTLGSATGAAESGSPDALVLNEDDQLVLDRAAASLRRAGEDVHLTRTEYRLLETLAENAGRVLSRRSLLERVWDHGFFGDERIVDVHVRRLRRKIERQPSDPEVLVTVRGLGYRLDPT
jgi:DNA-binding response OmpR family regulator